MPTIDRDNARSSRTTGGKVWRWVTSSWIPRVAAVLVVVLLAVAWFTVGPDGCEGRMGCPRMGDLRTGNAFDEGHHLIGRDGEQMSLVNGTKRAWVPMERIPERMVRAWIAVEDKRFNDHDGLDLQGIARATWANVTSGGVNEGASTIPMQLVRVLWEDELADMNKWERKLFEARMAPQLVDDLGRTRVMELYLNGIYLAGGTYGVGAASRHFFGVPPEELTVGQMATLVGMTKTPERYNPRKDPQAAKERRDVVLGILEAQGVISPQIAQEARAEPMETVEAPPFSYERDYVSAAVQWELKRVAPELAGRNGLVIYTTVDPTTQKDAMRLVTEHIDDVEAGRYGKYLPGGDDPLQAAAIAIESSTGEILSIVGGRGFEQTQLNRPLQSRRQIGSLAKPFILAAALRNGQSAAIPISTDPVEVKGAGGRMWSPDDHVGAASLLPRDMVVQSSNRAAVRLGMNVGMSRFAGVVRSMGVDQDIPDYPSSYLGAFDATLAEVTAAFAVFENGGYRVHPHLIRRVEDGDGRVLWERSPVEERVRVLSPSTAYLVLDAMQGVVSSGTGWMVGRDVSGATAGKTGTTNDGKDVWFVGMRPGLSVGVWLGVDQPTAITSNASGGGLATPLWSRWVTRLAAVGYGTGDGWRQPPGLEVVHVRSLQGPDGTVSHCSGESGGTAVLMRNNDALYLTPCDRMMGESPYYRIGESWASDSLGRADRLRSGIRFGYDTTYRTEAGYDSIRARLAREAEERDRRYDSIRAAIAGERRSDVGDSVRRQSDAIRDTLDARSSRRPAGPPRDTVRVRSDTMRPAPSNRPDTVTPVRPRPDTSRPPVPRPDTIRPDTIRPDTLPLADAGSRRPAAS